MAKRDDHLEEQLAKDIDRFQELLDELREEYRGLDKLEVGILKEVNRAKKDVDNMIRKVERLCENSFKHHKHILNRNKLWRENVEKEIREQYANHTPPAPEEEDLSLERGAYNTIDGIIRLVVGISLTDTVRAPDFEAQSYAFLIDSVFARTLAGESRSYFLPKRLEIQDLVEEGATLIALLREEYSCSLLENEEVWNDSIAVTRDWWETVALPRIFGGVDPDWEYDDTLPYDYMLAWTEREVTNATWQDCLDLMERVKYGARQEEK